MTSRAEDTSGGVAPAGGRSVAEANAKIAARYDQVPYVSNPFPQSHPSRLAAVAQLFGLATPSVERARVLEIGCASGGNIIPLAANYPEADITGLELSGVQANQGNERISRLGLANARIINGDVVGYSPDPEQFDFILCHGVYSWASPPARAAILAVIAKGLSKNGVAFVSYNVLPGWRHKQVLRDALMSRVHGLTDTSAQIAYARGFLEAIKDWNGPDSAYHRDLRETATHAMTIADDYLAHEFLENYNEPQTFMQFAEECAEAKLAFLGECEMWMQLADNFETQTQQLLRKLSGNQILPMEQSIDILTGRTFRQSLLVHARRQGEIDRTIERSRLAGLHYVGPLRLLPEAETGFERTYVGGSGRRISTNAKAAQRVFDWMIANEPASLSHDVMLAMAETEAERAAMIEAVFRSVTAGVISVRTLPVSAATQLFDQPRAPAWCRSDAAAGRSSIANLRHEPVGLDIVGQMLLPLLDGTRNWQDLCVALLDKVRDGELRFSRNDANVIEPADIRACADEHVARTLEQLRARAVLAA